MELKYLWDTNTAIYYLQNQFSATAEAFIDSVLRDDGLVVSVITEMELLCWPDASDKDLKLVQAFISESKIVELEKEVKILAIIIRRKHKLKLPDAIIAATAMVYNLRLLTTNIKDFQRVAALNYLDLLNES